MVELFLKSEEDVTNANLDDVEMVRAQLNTQLKKMLTTERFIGKEDISQILLINCFWVAALIDIPADEDLQQALLSLLKSWFEGPNKRFIAEDYER